MRKNESKQVKKRKRKVNVVVESVVPFDAEQQTCLFERLKQVLDTDKIQIRFALNPDLLGGATVKMNGQLLDLSVAGQIQRFQSDLTAYKTTSLDMKKLADMFQKKAAAYHSKPLLCEVGDVVSVSDGVARITGLNTLMAGERVLFASGAEGLALNLNATGTDAVVLEHADTIAEGDHVSGTGRMSQMPVGLSLLGRVVNPLGHPLDDREPVDTAQMYPVFAPAPGIVARAPVKTPVQTGIKAIDSLVPIGRGQRELIIGDRQTGKTTLILDTIISQRQNNARAAAFKDKVFCVYVAIGQKQSTVREVLRVLQKAGAMDYTVIVSASASDGAAMQYLAPYAGCAVGEYFRDHGMHAIIFYDDLSKHAVAYREMSLLLKRPAGREAYPGDVFYLHSRLLERAAQMDEAHGGGSLTAIPVIETQEGDVSAYIPTNVISITDGQIFLESALFHQGVRPAVNVGLSVSRVGSAAQTAAMKAVAGTLKLDLSQYREVLSFSQLSSDLDAATRALLARGARLTEVMKQPPGQPLTPAGEVVCLFVGVKGYLDDMPVEKVAPFLSGLLDRLELQGSDILSDIDTSGQLSDKTAEKLGTFIRDYQAYLGDKEQAA